MSDRPDYPLTSEHSSQVDLWLRCIKGAMDEGGTAPHLELRRILGRVYADGYMAGRVTHYFDRPLDDGGSHE